MFCAVGNIHEKGALSLTIKGGTGGQATVRAHVQKYRKGQIEQEYVYACCPCHGRLGPYVARNVQLAGIAG
jgi:hypothetical protein